MTVRNHFFFCFLGRKHSDQVKCRYNHERRSTVSKEGRRGIKKVSFSLQFNFVLVISFVVCVLKRILSQQYNFFSCRLLEYEKGGRDASEFLKWQETTRKVFKY